MVIHPTIGIRSSRVGWPSPAVSTMVLPRFLRWEFSWIPPVVPRSCVRFSCPLSNKKITSRGFRPVPWCPNHLENFRTRLNQHETTMATWEPTIPRCVPHGAGIFTYKTTPDMAQWWCGKYDPAPWWAYLGFLRTTAPKFCEVPGSLGPCEARVMLKS